MKFNDHKLYSLYIGRWQPFHEGHKFIIDKALDVGKNVCVAIRDTEISSKNPYSAKQRGEMIRRVYGNRVMIMVIPDIESVNVGRNVGYEVNFIEPPEDIGKISGTNVRSGVETAVPKEVAEYIHSLKSTLWLTGLPCSGKTTLGKRIKEELDNRDYRTAHLDGDDVRGKLNADLGFSEKDRFENLRRVAHVAKLFNENGIFVIASFVSPMNTYRRMIKEIIGSKKLVYVKCSLEECQRRDVKGMYAKAAAGNLPSFTGVGDTFEEPENPDLVIDTEKNDIEECTQRIIQHFRF